LDDFIQLSDRGTRGSRRIKRIHQNKRKLLLPALAEGAAAMKQSIDDPAALHRDAILIDAMGSSVLLPTALIPPPPRNGRPLIDRALAAGLTAMNVTMGIAGIGMGIDNFRSMIGTIHGYLSYFELEGRLVHVHRVADIHRAKREGRLGIIFGTQGVAGKIEGDTSLLLILQRLGQRIVQICYNERDAVGCGCMETSDTGLTQFGRACIREMNHLGLVVDLAHAGPRTALDAAAFSTAPIIVSHANARRLCDNPRNLSDEVVRAIAGTGGVVGITAYAPFCEVRAGVRPSLDAYVDHIAYIADLVGIDHVGIGSDFFDGESLVRFERFFRRRYPDTVRDYTINTVYVDGLESVEDFPCITAGLARRGFAPDDISKILGGNFLRVFGEVWKD
jgi:membrane dipeptidase